MPPIEACARSAKTGCEQSQQTASLFDHLVGAGEQRRRYLEAKGVRGLDVDDKLELGGCLHGKLTGLGAAQDTVDIGRGATPQFGGIGAVG